MQEDGEIIFFKSVAPGKSTLFQWKVIHPKVFGQHKLDLFLKHSRHRMGYGGCGAEPWKTMAGGGVEYGQSNFMKFSKF